MKNKLRYILLLPLSMIYGSLVFVRNLLFDFGIFKSENKNVSLLVVGNLTVGGTGKTPHVEFLLEVLHPGLRIAVLSRGYKRRSKGFILISPDTDVMVSGDEPLQLAKKFPNIPIAVCENRAVGVDKLVELHPSIDLIILDDAFQHRSLNAGFHILLTDFNHLHTRDSILPGGNLRESVKGSKRANVIIVTKCPFNLSPIDQRIIEREIKPESHQEVFFSTLQHLPIRPLFSTESDKQLSLNSLKDHELLLVTGIVSPQPIIHELSDKCKKLDTVNFPDHHQFSFSDLIKVEKQFNLLTGPDKLIIVTEKDAVRLINNSHLPDSIKKYIFVIPVKVQLLNDQTDVFTKKIIEYVRENKRDS